MRVVHANWSPDAGRLLVWGEDSALPPCAPRRPGRRPKVARLRRHPFACSVEQARGAAAALAQATDGEAREAVLLLPSGKDGPRCSPGLLRDEPAEAALETPAGAGLAPWSVPVLALRPEQALDLLLALPAGSPPGVAASEVAAGDSLRVLAEVAKLAIEVVTRGCVVPALECRDDRWLARWRPFRLTSAVPLRGNPGELGGRLELLCRGLPALGRAAIEPERFATAEKTARKEGWERLAMPPASALVDDLLPALVDRLVRDALSGERLAPVRRGRRPKVLPAAEAWLSALAAPDPAVTGAAAEDLARLAAELDTWFAVPAAGARGPFRTCFRLMPPGTGDAAGSHDAVGSPAHGDGESWQIEFLLQARDDPSLLVPADKVWRTRRGALTVLERRLDNPQEHLLGELGRATSLYPALEEALRSARPAALALSTEGAWHFLRQGASLLEQSGFGVLAPAWWKKPGAGLGVKLKASSRRKADGSGAATSSGLLGQEGLCAFEWSAALGGEELSLDELRRLAALKVPLVKTRGQWVEVRPDEIEQALAFLERHAAGGEASTL
ncbi:MAG: hypothetical protein GY719_32925, partial [bacterium]|nr:hypothetical protein [bacterium]